MTSKQILAILKFILFFSLGGLILFLLYRSQANSYAEQCIIDGIAEKDCNYFHKIISDFKSVKIGWLLVIVLLYMLSNISRSFRWVMMFNSLDYKVKFSNALGTLMFGYFANLGFPRLGEVIRPLSMSRYEKIKFEKVVGTVVSERALDVFMLLIFIGLALLFEFDTLWGFIQENESISERILAIVTHPITWIIMILIIVVSVLFVRSTYFKTTLIGRKIIGIIKGLWEGIQSIFKLKRPGIFILHTVFIWVMYFLMTRLCFFAFEPTSGLTTLAGLLIFVFGTLGIVFPSPGGMGSYHALLMAGLAIYGIEQSDSFSFANIIFFTIQLFCNVAFGLTAYLLLPLINKHYNGATRI
jgi:uncharacterized protein (TIRG00374 family)